MTRRRVELGAGRELLLSTRQSKTTHTSNAQLSLNDRILQDAEFDSEFVLLPDGTETVYNGPCDDGMVEVLL